MWVVCGPPRSATTTMLEAVAAWTTLTVRWDLQAEWYSRQQTSLAEHFYETSDHQTLPGDVVKILNPHLALPTPTRAVLMIRDPHEVSRSARKLGQRISPADVTARVEAFRHRWPERVDDVHIRELTDMTALFRRLETSGWPVAEPAYQMATKAVR